MPPRKNSTFVMDPLVADAFATSVIAAPSLNVALFAGLVNDTTGGLLPELTLIEIAADVVTALLLSIAFAVSV